MVAARGQLITEDHVMQANLLWSLQRNHRGVQYGGRSCSACLGGSAETIIWSPSSNGRLALDLRGTTISQRIEPNYVQRCAGISKLQAKRCIKNANCSQDELRCAQHYNKRYTRTTTRVLKRMQHTKPLTLQQYKKHDTGGIELQWCKHAGNVGGHHVMRRTVFF